MLFTSSLSSFTTMYWLDSQYGSENSIASARSSVTVIAASARSASPFSRYMERESKDTLIISRSTPRPSAISFAISRSTPTTFSPSMYSNGGHAASVATTSFPFSSTRSRAVWSSARLVNPALRLTTIASVIQIAAAFFIMYSSSYFYACRFLILLMHS